MKITILFLSTIIMLFILNSMNLINSKNKNIITIGFMLVTLCIPFKIRLNINDIFINEIHYATIRYTFIFLICIIFINKIFYREYRKIRFTIIDIGFIVIFINILFNYFNNEIYERHQFLNVTFTYISIYIIISIFKRLNKSEKELILNSFSYIAVFNGILSVAQFITNKKLLIGLFNEPIIYTEGISIVRRAVGIAGTNNSAGNLSAILFSICLYNYLKSRKKIDLIGVILNLIASALTLTRIAYLAIGIEILIYFTISKWNSIKDIINKIKFIFIIGIPVIILIKIKWNTIINILFKQRGDTASYRFFQFENIIKYILNEVKLWDGIGVGQYRSYLWNNYRIKEIDLHSQMLNVLVDQGWIVFTIFILINLYLLIKAMNSSENIIKRAFILSLFIANLICSNFNPNQFYYINNILYITLICSCIEFKYYKFKW